MQWGPRKYPNEFWINSAIERTLTQGITPNVGVFYPFSGKKLPASTIPDHNSLPYSYLTKTIYFVIVPARLTSSLR